MIRRDHTRGLENGLKRASGGWFLVSAALVLGLTNVIGAQCLPRYEVEAIIQGPSSGEEHSPTNAYGIAETQPYAVGYYNPNVLGNDRAYLYDGEFTPLTFPGGSTWSRAYDVTDAKEIVGQFEPPSARRGFLRQGSTFIDLGVLPGGNWSDAKAITAVGRIIVGEWGDTVNGPYPLAFVWDGKMQDISAVVGGPLSSASDISDTRLVTGWAGEAPSIESQAFIYDYQTGNVLYLPLPDGAISVEGTGISNDGKVCGVVLYPNKGNPTFRRHGFFWDGRELIDLGFLSPPGDWYHTRPADIAEDGLITGTAETIQGGLTGFIWHSGMIARLNNLVPSDPWVNIITVRAISATGTIVANGQIVGDTGVAFILKPNGPRAGDFDCDEDVDVDDLLGVVNHWGPCPPPEQRCPGDVNFDRTVNIDDLLQVINDWGAKQE